MSLGTWIDTDNITYSLTTLIFTQYSLHLLITYTVDITYITHYTIFTVKETYVYYYILEREIYVKLLLRHMMYTIYYKTLTWMLDLINTI